MLVLFVYNFLYRQIIFLCKKKLIWEIKLEIYNHHLYSCEIKLPHDTHIGIVDGKVCCAYSCRICYTCGSTQNVKNDIGMSLSKPVDSNKYQFGLSSFHSWVSSFKYFITCFFQNRFQQMTSVFSRRVNSSCTEKNTNVPQKFRQWLGRIVDKLRTSGCGTANDRNTAKIFFFNYLFQRKYLDWIKYF